MTTRAPLLTLVLVVFGVACTVGLGRPAPESEPRAKRVALARLPRRTAAKSAGAPAAWLESDEWDPGSAARPDSERGPAAKRRATYAQLGHRLLSFAARLEHLNMKLHARARTEARRETRPDGKGDAAPAETRGTITTEETHEIATMVSGQVAPGPRTNE